LVKSRDKKIQVVYFGGFEADYLMIRQAMLEEYKRLEKLRDEYLLLPVPVINPLEGYSLDNPADAAWYPVTIAALRKLNADKESISREDWEKLKAMYDKIEKNVLVRGVRTVKTAELSLRVSDEDKQLAQEIAEYLRDNDFYISRMTRSGRANFQMFAALAVYYTSRFVIARR